MAKPWSKSRTEDGLWLLLGDNRVARLVDSRAEDDILIDFILAGLNWAAAKRVLDGDE